MFIRNCWYVVAWEHEIPADGFFTRTVIGEPLLLYRTSAGTVVALEDRCCHRGAPLSCGRREGDAVRCGYHGLKFAADGRCIEIPGLAEVPAKVRVRRYPVVLKNRWVFVWMGDDERADAALLPDNFSNDHPDWKHIPDYLHYDTAYLLICDNLLDFSHLSWVHEKTLGGSTAIAQARPVIEPVPQGLRVTRIVRDVPPPPYYLRMRPIEGRIDRWFVYDFLLPGTLLMHSGGRPAQGPDAPAPGPHNADPATCVRLHSCQTLTPETEHATHYFFQQSHPADQGDEALTRTIHQSLITAFNEDRDMITAQARSIAMRPDAPMVPLAMDAALTRFRRLVDDALAAERARDA
ncbi:MAG: aromatic ring-hydroxylating dioxygenase subunit alpha [Burkholderiaceae bacterium]